MEEVVIVSGCRTPIGGFGGTLLPMNGASLAAITMKEAVKRAGIDPVQIDDIRYGCCMESSDTLNVARVGALLAGIPESVTAATINRVCISGMEAMISGMAMIQAGMADIIAETDRLILRTIEENDAAEQYRLQAGQNICLQYLSVFQRPDGGAGFRTRPLSMI